MHVIFVFLIAEEVNSCEEIYVQEKCSLEGNTKRSPKSGMNFSMLLYTRFLPEGEKKL